MAHDRQSRRSDRASLFVAGIAVLLAVLLFLWTRPDTAPEPVPAFATDEPPPDAPPEPPGGDLDLPPPTVEIPASVDLPVGGPFPFQGGTYTLANGLTVIAVPDHTQPSIAYRLVVGAGSADDPPGYPGTAHLLEHMMDQGTPRIATRDWAIEERWRAREAVLLAEQAAAADLGETSALQAELAEVGARANAEAILGEFVGALTALGVTRTNATTHFDHTDYFGLLPANAVEPWAELMAEQFRNPVWRGFPTERRIVQLELTGRGYDHSVTPRERLYGSLFAGHPYASAVLATSHDMARSHPGVIDAFFEAAYTPRNMALVLVGDVDPPSLIPLLDRTFGAIPDRPLGLGPIDDLGGLERRAVEEVMPPDRVVWMWRLPPLRGGAALAMDLVAHVLQAELKRQGFDEPEARFTRFAHASLLTAEATCRLDDAQVCRTAGPRILRRVGRRGDRFAGELRSTAVRVALERLESLESIDTHAERIADGWARGDSLQSLAADERSRLGLDPGDVITWIRRLVRPHQVVIGVPGPGGEPPPSTYSEAPTTDVGRGTSAFVRSLLDRDLPPIDDTWLAEGPDFDQVDGIVVVKNPYNPLFQATLTYPRGFSEEPLACEAIADFLSGAGMELRQEMARDGVFVRDLDCGPFEVSVTIGGLPGGAGDAVWRLDRAMRRADASTSDTTPWQRGTVRAVELQAVRGAALYGPNALWRPFLFDRPRATADDLRRARVQIGAASPSVAYFGPHALSQVSGWVGRPTPPAERPSLGVPTPTSFLVRPPGSPVQAGRSLGAHDPSRTGRLVLYEAWLGGRAGTLFEAIRTRHGQAYGVQTELLHGDLDDPASLLVTVSMTLPDAVDVVDTLLGELQRTSIDESAWRRIRGAALANTHHGPRPPRQRARQVFDGLDSRGRYRDPNRRAHEQIEALDRLDFVAFLEEVQRRPVVFGVPYEAGDQLVELRTRGPVVLTGGG